MSKKFLFIVNSEASELILTFKTRAMISSSADEDAGINYYYYNLN